MRAFALLLMTTLFACTGEGEEVEELGPSNTPPGLNLTVESPVGGTFHGGPWTYKLAAAWYVNAKGEKLRQRFVIDNTRDKNLRVKLWELVFNEPCSDAYGSLAGNRWLTFTVPATPGITKDPEQGYRYPGGLVRVAYVNNTVEHTQVAESVVIDLDATEPVVRGTLAAYTQQNIDKIALAGEFAAQLCVDDP